MDHKEKYKEALERCKKEFNFNNLAYSHEEIKQRLERVFPELKESEDEEIRIYLINFIKINDGVNLPPDYAKKALAWLEKQKDHEDELEKVYKTYRKGFEDGVASVKTAEWSEKDDYIFNNVYEFVQENEIDINRRLCVEECLAWLKCIKEKMKGE